MKRLERLGSAAFLTVILSLVFHLLAMSFNNWLNNVCLNCDQTNPLASWKTSLTQRCYQASMASIFYPSNDSISNAEIHPFITQICIPNQYLMVKDKSQAQYCLAASRNHPDTICSISAYNQKFCKCDYTTRTKVILAMTIISSFSLGIMIFLSHLISFVKIDYVLRWLIPVCFTLLICSIICMIVTLSVAGSHLDNDLNEIRYSSSLLVPAFDNQTVINSWIASIDNSTTTKYKITVGWCFGLEYLALHFSVVSLLLYALMFIAKKRPEPTTPNK